MDRSTGSCHHEHRDVPLPRFLCVELARFTAGRKRDDLVFAGVRDRQPIRVSVVRRAFDQAATQIGVPGLHPHQLRHSAASLAITSEAGVKVVQRMLGHASATMTLDANGHFFEDRLDEVGTALDIAQQSTQEAHQE